MQWKQTPIQATNKICYRSVNLNNYPFYKCTWQELGALHFKTPQILKS